MPLSYPSHYLSISPEFSLSLCKPAQCSSKLYKLWLLVFIKCMPHRPCSSIPSTGTTRSG